MIKRLSPICVVLLCLLSATANAQEQARVLVLPFEINADADLAYLATQIPEVLQNHLRQDGALIIEPDPAQPGPTGAASAEDFRQYGQRMGADWVIWGSMTRIGQQFSLDAKMVAPIGETTPTLAYQEGQTIENLPTAVREISRGLGKKIFQQVLIGQIRVTGNKRIETDAIIRVIKTGPGDVFSAQDLSQDLKAVYALGYFDDVRIESQDGSEGRILTFQLKEKPTLRLIRFKGNRVFDDEKLTENLDISTGSILNVFQLEKNVKRIETLYQEKNYHNVQVAYNIQPLPNDQADLEFVIQEGNKIWIQSIAFQGNTAYSDAKLKRIMKTAEKGFFSWITSSGDLTQEDLDQDVERITAFYNNNGYILAKVADPIVAYKDDGIHITVKIDEGSRFTVGAVDVSGDTVLPKEQLMGKLKITRTEYFNRDTVRMDVLTMADLYYDLGYAYAEIRPLFDYDQEKLSVAITYAVEKGEPVRFERINIQGNTKTRDKVIRRELDVHEQDLFSGTKIKEGIQNLHRLDYFEDIKVNRERGSSEDTMLLNIDVTEKPTGVFSFGGGYSADENFFAMANVSQRNLFGRGQTLSLKAQLGSRTNRYTLSFVEPWLLDIPLSAGIDAYNWRYSYDEYDKDAVGSRVRFSYPVFGNTRAAVGYVFEIADVNNIDPDAANSIKELEGKNTLSAVDGGLFYDSRDQAFNATRGSVHNIVGEYAGLGGDIGFTKFTGGTAWYIPLFLDTVGFVHARAGWVNGNQGGILPDYEKFYLGGVNTVRGFPWRSIGLEDENGAAIGGDKMVVFNVEYQIPLIKKAGLMGVVFYDAGNVFADDESIDFGSLRSGIGYGFRWLSPIGPIRIENGYILNPRPGEDENGRWEFAMGAPF